MSKRVLVGNYALRFGVALIERLAGLVIVPLLVAQVGTEGLGYYGLAMSVVLVFVNILSLRFPMAMIRFFPASRAEAGPPLAVGLAFWASLAAATMIALLAAPGFLAGITFADRAQIALLVLAVAVGLLTTLYEFVSVPLRAENKFGLLSVADSGERLLFIALCLLAFHLGSGTVAAVLIVLLVTTVLRVAAVLPASLKGVHWKPATAPLARDMFNFCLPFLPHLGAVWLIERGAFFLVAQQLGAAQTGVFTLAFAFASLLMAAVLPLQMTLYPMLSRAYDAGRDNVVRDLVSVSQRIALGIGTFGTITLCIGMEHLLAILQIDEPAPPMLLMLVLALAFTCSALRQIVINLLHITKDTRALVWISPIGGLIGVLVGVLTIDRLGLLGAAAGMLAGTVTQLIGMNLRAPQRLRTHPSLRFLFALSVAAVLAAALQIAAKGLGAWPYVAGTILAGVIFLSALYRLGGVTAEERATLWQIRRRPEATRTGDIN